EFVQAEKKGEPSVRGDYADHVLAEAVVDLGRWRLDGAFRDADHLVHGVDQQADAPVPALRDHDSAARSDLRRFQAEPRPHLQNREDRAPQVVNPADVGGGLGDARDPLHADHLSHALDAKGVKLVVEREGDELQGDDGLFGLLLVRRSDRLDEADDLLRIRGIRLRYLGEDVLGEAEGGKFLTHATSPLPAASATSRSGARRRTTAPSASRAAPSTGARSPSAGSRAWKTKSCWPSSASTRTAAVAPAWRKSAYSPSVESPSAVSGSTRGKKV